MTRIGIIADIHGNLYALRHVLAELESLGADEVICLGDVAVLGPHPQQVIDLLRERGIPTVCGNTDAWLIEGHHVPALAPDSPMSRSFVDWARTNVSASSLEWLSELPLAIERDAAGVRVCFCHGSPRHTDDIIVNMSGSEVGEFGYDWIVGGHTHQQANRMIGSTTYLNPGSAGLPGAGPGQGVPIHQCPHWAEFAVLDDSPRISVTLHRVDLDLERMLANVEATSMPERAWWRHLWKAPGDDGRVTG